MKTMNKESRALHLLGVSNQKASHIKLVKGVAVRNSPITVLCPKLAEGRECKKGWQCVKGRYKRPELLLKNFGDPSLQLWMCQGCRDKFLLRVKV